MKYTDVMEKLFESKEDDVDPVFDFITENSEEYSFNDYDMLVERVENSVERGSKTLDRHKISKLETIPLQKGQSGVLFVSGDNKKFSAVWLEGKNVVRYVDYANRREMGVAVEEAFANGFKPVEAKTFAKKFLRAFTTGAIATATVLTFGFASFAIFMGATLAAGAFGTPAAGAGVGIGVGQLVQGLGWGYISARLGKAVIKRSKADKVSRTLSEEE